MFIYLIFANITAYNLIVRGEAVPGIIFAVIGGSVGAKYALRYAGDEFPAFARRIVNIIFFIQLCLLALIPESV